MKTAVRAANNDLIRAEAIRHSQRAIAISRQKLGEEAWTRLGDWVTAHIVESAKYWAIEQALTRGRDD